MSLCCVLILQGARAMGVLPAPQIFLPLPEAITTTTTNPSPINCTPTTTKIYVLSPDSQSSRSKEQKSRFSHRFRLRCDVDIAHRRPHSNISSIVRTFSPCHLLFHHHATKCHQLMTLPPFSIAACCSSQ